jgi:hypothetical protein
MRTWVLPFLVGVLLVALVGVSVVAVVQTRQLEEERARSADLEAEVAELRADVEDLESRLASSGLGEGGLPGALGGLLGGDIGGLLEELLDGEGGGLLDGLLGGDGGSLGGLLDGLTGGDGDALGGLLGAGETPGARCLLPGASGGGFLEGLLGGLAGSRTPAPDATDAEAVVDTIAAQVGDLRELAWENDVEVTFLDDGAVRARLDELFADEAAIDRDQAELEGRLLAALGAIPPDTDLVALQQELLEDSVAGFYVDDTGELVVRVPDDGRIRGIDRITIAHELQHALADQTLGLPARDEPPLRDDADAALAALAVAEGDASLVMNLWALEHVPLTEQLGALGDPDIVTAQAALERVPHYLQRALLSPYTDGLDWVCERWLEGGWAAVDAAYADPPTTTAEVLFGDPVATATTAGFGSPAGFSSIGTTTLGAAPLLWLLEAPGGDPDRSLDEPRARAAAWGGGAAEVWVRGDEDAVGLALVDRGTPGAPPLCGTIGELYAAAVPDARELAAERGRVWRSAEATAVLRCDGDDVVLAVAPDLGTATAIAGG